MMVAHLPEQVRFHPDFRDICKGERMSDIDYMSYGDVARALNTTLARAKGLMNGLEPSLKAGNGRVVLFTRAEVQTHLYKAHRDVIRFIGYPSLSEVPDLLASLDASSSKQ